MKLQGSSGGDIDIANRFYLAYTGTAPTNSTLTTFCGTVASAWNTDIAPVVNDDFTLTTVDAEDVSLTTGAVGAATTSHVGGKTGAILSQQCATLLNFSVARRYRGGKPRLYLPASTSPDLTSATSWSASYIAAVNTAWTNFISALIATPWSGGTITGQVNVSYYTGFTSFQNPITLRWYNLNTPRATPIVDPIISHACNALVGTQRRRINA